MYTDPKTGKEVKLSGTPGEQNLAVNRAGYNWTPASGAKTASSPPAPAVSSNPPPAPGSVGSKGTTLAEDQARAARQGKPGYDIMGDPIGTTSGATPRYPTEGVSSTKISAAEEAYLAGQKPEDPTAKAKRIQDEYASEIASIQQYYRGLVSRQDVSNVASAGRVRAMAAAKGELGQDIGASEQSKEEAAGQERVGFITREEQAKEAAVYGAETAQIESEILQEKKDKTAADLKRIEFLKTQADSARQKMQTIAGATDLKDLPQKEYDALYEASGFANPNEFNTFYAAMRQSALTGGQTIGDASTGVWQKQADGTWKTVIPGQKVVGDPTTGVWKQKADGEYYNVIPAAPKIGAIGAQGSYIYKDGQITTIKPAAPKIVSSGGVIYSVDVSSGKAKQLTSNIQGWQGAKGSAGDQEKAAILSYVHSLGLPQDQADKLNKSIQSNPDAYYTALGNASQSGFYTPLTVSAGTTPTPDTASSDAAANMDMNPPAPVDTSTTP